ncbi:MAG: WD40/YVTN/BNR-like repeat-containing protein [Acidobacteriota bacterium]
MKPPRLAACLFLLTALACSAQLSAPERYSWKNVQIVGGGFVDGIVFHPSAPGVRYARTDIGGAYRWDEATRRWQPLLDWISYKDRNLTGVESIAVDPSDPNRIYLACGTYTNANTPDGAILRSADRGKTWQRTNVPVKFGANEDGRGNGERLSVDPQDGRILYLGTRQSGLWRSRDRGATWTRVSTFPDITETAPALGDGIVFVHFVPAAGLHPHTATQTLYVGVSLMNRANLFVSKDAGATWQPVAGAPTRYRPTRAALSTDKFLYIAYGTAPGPSRMTDGAVWKLNTQSGAWTDITPEHPVRGSKEFGYAAVTVDPQHPQTLLASTFGRPGFDGGETIFRSTDAGATWKPLFGNVHSGILDPSLAPYVAPTPIHWMFDIEIDPLNSNHAVFTTGYGGWETFDLSAIDRGQPTHWSILVPGIEETVALQLDSPADGPHLISAIGDYGGFVHWDLDRPAPDGSSAPPRFGNTTGVASAALRPNVIVRVGINAQHKPGENISYSLDSGRTWHPTAARPTLASRAGSVAVSADGATWVWTPDHEAPSVTRDRGATWKTVSSLTAGMRLIADPQNPRVFYAASLQDHKFYRSTDAAATFSTQSFTLKNAPATSSFPRGDPRGGQDRLYATPGRTGDLWFAAFDGLYRAVSLTAQPANAALSFVRMPGVSEIQAFGFGKAAPGHSDPALYLVGSIQGQPGIFRSLDEARTWTRINDDQHQWGLILQITGDPRVYGRVYVGTHGRGILYGDPAQRPLSNPRRQSP